MYFDTADIESVASTTHVLGKFERSQPVKVLYRYF